MEPNFSLKPLEDESVQMAHSDLQIRKETFSIKDYVKLSFCFIPNQSFFSSKVLISRNNDKSE